MHKLIRSSVIAALMLAALPAAQAASYSFSGVSDSGPLLGQSLSGSLSFNDAGRTGRGFELFSLDSLDFVFAGQSYSLGNADVAPDVSYLDGNFLGLSYSASAGQTQLAFIAGTFEPGEAFLAYTHKGLDGAASIVYAPVPEPEAYAMLLAGLGLLGLAARRRRVLSA
ncbi:PEP-CTERM sorting domain-containing protein [Rhodocyclus tenuis]|uniref:PEP-CTERM sorting domain-containing protein n=1 Tax=Rhodocyclus tenuis TaxID=1066 RepID=UPI001908F43F|nr:PEP-CTERM sorting domain-containing protein [Rhodocyclus tenuis]MBK1679874.1 hypothetical protein [Rhodocyclus tenuis]